MKRVLTQEELKEILEKHRIWLSGRRGRGAWNTNLRAIIGGKRADLSCVDLENVNLEGVDLCEADLAGAYLKGANLINTRLDGANLTGANFFRANLTGANLTGALCINTEFTGACLENVKFKFAILAFSCFGRTNVNGADFTNADLYRASFGLFDTAKTNLADYIPLACPEKGSFIGFKKARTRDGEQIIVELEIPADALRCSSSGRKCRCSKAKVISITRLDGSKTKCKYAYPLLHNAGAFKYTLGEAVEADDFDGNRSNTCTSGIHFFITRQEAVNYS